MRPRALRLSCGRLVVVVLALAGLGANLTSQIPGPRQGPTPLVILVSLDGFRWDYLQKANAPNLQRIASRGVRAERLIPAFPTKTFPNHYTIVTGLYPGHHALTFARFLLCR